MRLELGALLMVSNGLLPKADMGPALTLGVVPSGLPIRFEWRGSYRLPLTPPDGADFRAVQQEWRGCYAPHVFDVVFVTACIGAAWTAILPDTRGLAGGDHAPKNVFSPTLSAGPAFAFGDMRFFADFGLARPSPRYAFTYLDDGRATHVHEVSRIGWSIGIGASRSFL
jgi:hypothetical protein